MSRPTNTEERRVQIAGGLIRVMAIKGYDGASITEIAKAAHLTQGLVHYHFKDKQEILLVALHNLVTRHDTLLADRLAVVADDPVKELAAFIDFHLGLGANADPEALACWILLSGEALRRRKVQREYEKAIKASSERLAAIIRSGVTQGIFQCESVDAAAIAIAANIQGYFVLAATARSTIPKGSASQSVKLMAQGLLRSKQPIDLAREGLR